MQVLAVRYWVTGRQGQYVLRFASTARELKGQSGEVCVGGGGRGEGCATNTIQTILHFFEYSREEQCVPPSVWQHRRRIRRTRRGESGAGKAHAKGLADLATPEAMQLGRLPLFRPLHVESHVAEAVARRVLDTWRSQGAPLLSIV
jgi:hypothetical protein